MSGKDILPTEELHKKAYDALKAYRDEWKEINIERLVSDGVLKPMRGGYQVLDHNRLPDAAKKHIKSIKSTANGAVMIISKPDQRVLKKIDKFFD